MTAVRKLEIRVNQTGNARNAIGRLSGGLLSLGTAAAGVVAIGIGAATAAIVTLGAKSAQVAGDFQDQMNILEVAARQSETSLEDLSEAAIQVGADTDIVGVSASEAAEAMTNFYKAGFTTGEIFSDLDEYLAGNVELTGALRSAVDLAAASELSLAEASDVVAIAMATFGMNTEEAGAIADSFVASADASVASVPELTQALANVGPTAATFGWSLDTVNIGLALLSERGIRGAEAGTALKSMMTNLMRETDPVKESLAELNVTLYDSEGVMKDLPTIMAYLEEAMSSLTDEERNHHIQVLAGTYGMKAMQTLLAEGTVGWQEMTSSVAAGATAQETAAARTRGYNAAVEQMQGSIESLMIRAGTPLINDFLTPAIQLFTEWLPTLEALGRDAIPVIVDALQRIIQAFKGTNEEVDLSDEFLKGLTTTLNLVVTAIELTAIVMQGLAGAVEGVRHAIGTLTIHWNEMKRAAREAIDAIPDWLRPGSPTPFETGLRGIADAARDIDLGMGAPVGAGAGVGGGGITVILNYSPAVSLADRYEAEERLAPFIANALRAQLGVTT